MALPLLAQPIEGTGASTQNYAGGAALSLGAGVEWDEDPETNPGTLHDESASADEVIDSNINPDGVAWSAIVHFYLLAGGTANYWSLISKGGVFENDSRFAFGVRVPTLGSGLMTFFCYGRNGSSLVGSESNTGMPTPEAGVLYRAAFNWNAEDGLQTYLQEAAKLSSADPPGSNGGQNIKLAGPNSFTNSDRSSAIRLVRAAAWNEYIAEEPLLALSADMSPLFAAAAAALSGTATEGITEQDVRDGGKQIIITLSGGALWLPE